MDNYHLINENDQWKLKKEGNSKASKVFEGNKDEATKQSASYLKESGGGSLKIHKKDGKIQEERTYPKSADPSKSPG